MHETWWGSGDWHGRLIGQSGQRRGAEPGDTTTTGEALFAMADGAWLIRRDFAFYLGHVFVSIRRADLAAGARTIEGLCYTQMVREQAIVLRSDT